MEKKIQIWNTYSQIWNPVFRKIVKFLRGYLPVWSTPLPERKSFFISNPKKKNNKFPSIGKCFFCIIPTRHNIFQRPFFFTFVFYELLTQWSPEKNVHNLWVKIKRVSEIDTYNPPNISNPSPPYFEKI